MDGEGVLLREDAEVWPASVKNWANEYYVLSVTEGITGLREKYLEAFLILNRSIVSVGVTPALIKRMRRRKVLIRGEYDSFPKSSQRETGSIFCSATSILPTTI